MRESKHRRVQTQPCRHGKTLGRSIEIITEDGMSDVEQVQP